MSSNRSELLPCPFCGGHNVELYSPPLSRLTAVHCGDCEIRGETAIDKDAAVSNWNTRAATTQGNRSELVERLERVEKQLSACADSYEAPNGKIMLRVWVTDLAAVARLARTAIRGGSA